MSIDVSREIMPYVALLQKWNQKINLVGKSTIENIWERHILDSIQLTKFCETQDHVIDLGSGAGLPGMVLALAGIRYVTLVESDQRKAAFLRQAAKLAPYKVNVINERIENIELDCDILTARACASVNDILKMTSKIKIQKKILLLKGKDVHKELESIDLKYKLHKSVTKDGWIVEMDLR